MAAVQISKSQQDAWQQLIVNLPDVSDRNEMEHKLNAIIAVMANKIHRPTVSDFECTAVVEFCQRVQVHSTMQTKAQNVIQEIVQIAWNQLIDQLPYQRDLIAVERNLDGLIALLSNEIYKPIVNSGQRSAILNFCQRMQGHNTLLTKTQTVADMTFPLIALQSGNVTQAISNVFFNLEEDMRFQGTTTYNINLKDSPYIQNEPITEEQIQTIQNYLRDGEIVIKDHDILLLLHFAHTFFSQDLFQKIERWVENNPELILLNAVLLEKFENIQHPYLFDDFPKLRALLPKGRQISGLNTALRRAIVSTRNQEALTKLQETDALLRPARQMRLRAWNNIKEPLFYIPLFSIYVSYCVGICVGAIFGPLGVLIGAGSGLLLGLLIGLSIDAIWALYVHLKTRIKLPAGYPFKPDPLLNNKKARKVCKQLRKADLKTLVKKGYTGERLVKTGFISEQAGFLMDTLIAKQNEQKTQKAWISLQRLLAPTLPF